MIKQKLSKPNIIPTNSKTERPTPSKSEFLFIKDFLYNYFYNLSLSPIDSCFINKYGKTAKVKIL